MSSIYFERCFLRYADLRFKDKAGTYCVLHMTADLTDEVIKAMEWEAPPECAEMVKFEGGLNGRVMTLVPDQSPLKSHTLTVELSGLDDFKYFRVAGSDDKSEHGELRFTARSSEVNAIAKVEGYLRVVGQGTARMSVAVEVQQKLEIEPTVAPVAKKGKRSGLEVVQ